MQEDEEQAGSLLVEDKEDKEESCDSEAEDAARLQRRPAGEAAWVDEDDELEEE